MVLARASGRTPIDLSLGVAADPPPRRTRRPSPATAAEYPLSRGTRNLREAAAGYLARRYGVTADPETIAASAGSKEFISTVPLFLREAGIGGPDRDTVLIPALGYPAYGLGARLAGLRTHRVPVDEGFRMRLDRVPPEVSARALCLWVNSPANPTGVVEPLTEITTWARAHGVLLLSDEAYADSTWCHDPRTALAEGPDGVLAVHSMSKRSNAPGLRVGFYAGDPAVVARLVPLRRAAGLIGSAEAQDAAADLLADDEHATAQRARNARRVTGLVAALTTAGLPCAMPEGGLFVWLTAPGGDGRAFARRLAERAGVVVMPGSEYGPGGEGHVRIAAVRDTDEIVERLHSILHFDMSAAHRPDGTGRKAL
ncbi:pyridoxal phosphate-dependent aminotransferase [Streptomyces graminilatus]|uniref:pyridoxal phosphate-dependent aminotransferase n=1 Tax=Streptomyces graminilatus TaxID=1464070 RepID=UPI000B241503|nr:aminotransferase class I/II-fold pyridoxal phosphate-dependent enzyme [Streptomyces graminilatus]